MIDERKCIALVLGLAGGMVVGVGGCGAGQTLPSQVKITLPDDTTSESKLGSGPTSLAGTEWTLFRVSNNQMITRLRFNSKGGVARMFDNVTVGAEIFGSTIKADGKMHNTSTDGVTYTAGSYGAENDSGFSFQLRAKAFFSGFEIGTGKATATGTHDGERMEGTFAFETGLTGLAESILPPEAATSEEFEFYATILEQSLTEAP